jgi:cytochrome c oxidase cbb3-type subunit 3
VEITQLLGLAALTAFAALAQTPGTDPVERGRLQFQQSCAFCHASDAAGAEGPSLILSAVVRHDQKGELIGKVIREGRPEKGMPALPLNVDQTSDIAAFLHARVKESDRRSAGEPGAGYSLSRLNTGNALAGQTFFAAHCASCHSPTGDLRGIALKYEPVELQTRFLYPPGVPQTAYVTTSSGQTISGPLSYSDPFTIAIHDKDGWYHSWSRNDVVTRVVDPLERHRELLGEYTGKDMHNVFAYLETLR